MKKVLDTIIIIIMILVALWFIGFICDSLNSSGSGYDDYYQDINDLPM